MVDGHLEMLLVPDPFHAPACERSWPGRDISGPELP
jgi:hypothetical protein